MTPSLLGNDHLWQFYLFPLNVNIALIWLCTFNRAWILSETARTFFSDILLVYYRGGGGREFILVLSLYSFSLMIRFICLVELVSAVFQFSFNFWISNCLPFSVGVLLSFLSKYSGQRRYQTRIQADCIEIHIDLAPSARLFLQRGPPFFFVNHLPCLLPCDSPWVKL